MDFATITTLVLASGTVNPAIADFVYELSTSDFGVLQYDPNLFGSYLEVRLPLSMFGVTGPEYIGRRIYFHWQTGMVAPGYIQVRDSKRKKEKEKESKSVCVCKFNNMFIFEIETLSSIRHTLVHPIALRSQPNRTQHYYRSSNHLFPRTFLVRKREMRKE